MRGLHGLVERDLQWEPTRPVYLGQESTAIPPDYIRSFLYVRWSWRSHSLFWRRLNVFPSAIGIGRCRAVRGNLPGARASARGPASTAATAGRRPCS